MYPPPNPHRPTESDARGRRQARSSGTAAPSSATGRCGARDATVGTDARWVVVLETPSRISDSALHRLVQLLAKLDAVALHCAERYAIQMEVSAGGCAEALFVASARLQSALAALHEQPAEIVRADVLSGAEFESECRRLYGDREPAATDATTSNRHLRMLSDPVAVPAGNEVAHHR